MKHKRRTLFAYIINDMLLTCIKQMEATMMLQWLIISYTNQT